jgi:UDP-N-acetylmuramoyl-tripeptide--D-alanyl-D-alanine ligase
MVKNKLTESNTLFAKLLQCYLRFWAKWYLNRAKPQIIAVTGSVGKTSTKNAIFEVLRVKYGAAVRKAEGNLNNETGVPLAILGMRQSPNSRLGWLPVLLAGKFKALFGKRVKILVLEMAADKPGDIKYLTSFVKPNIAVLTSIGPAHIEAFGEIEKVAAEKTELLNALPSDGWAVLNIDDEVLKKIAAKTSWQTKTLALNEKADITAKNITTEILDVDKWPQPLTKFQIVTGKVKFLAATKTLGRQTNIYPALAATAVGDIFGLSPAQIIDGLKNIKSEKHRLEVLAGKNGSLIIDDCYNANPLSMRAALDTLKVLPAKRKIAVLGDMLELGTISQKAHQIIGEYSRAIANQTVAIGDLAKDYDADQYFSDKNEAINYLLNEIREGDIILVKASRALALEEIVAALRER